MPSSRSMAKDIDCTSVLLRTGIGPGVRSARTLLEPIGPIQPTSKEICRSLMLPTSPPHETVSGACGDWSPRLPRLGLRGKDADEQRSFHPLPFARALGILRTLRPPSSYSRPSPFLPLSPHFRTPVRTPGCLVTEHLSDLPPVRAPTAARIEAGVCYPVSAVRVNNALGQRKKEFMNRLLRRAG